ncbi:MAG: hypothetical protein II930_09580, partial [Lachnospiraceae bacterium]|nr:hypothetical protein [Lachnospiraceae bacterium]
LILQSPYSVPQGQIHGSWWDIAKVIADDIKDAKDDAGLQAALDNYSKKMNELFNMDDSVKNAWTVIGAVGGSNWDKDFPMNEVDGKWKLAEPMELKAGDEFKVRKGLNWDDAFPAENFVVEADGTYTIVLDPATGEVTLEN